MLAPLAPTVRPVGVVDRYVRVTQKQQDRVTQEVRRGAVGAERPSKLYRRLSRPPVLLVLDSGQGSGPPGLQPVAATEDG